MPVLADTPFEETREEIMTTIAYFEIRCQHATGGQWPAKGPDKYVAVQIVPEDATPLKVLNFAAAKRRGITIKYIGEGYGNRTGPRSSLGKAIKEAQKMVALHNTQDQVTYEITWRHYEKHQRKS